MDIETRDDMADLMRERGASFVFTPVVTEQHNGSWVAQYPGADWKVTADDAEIARQRLREAELDRMRDPANSEWQVAAVRKYLSEGPIAGVYEVDTETSARIHASGDEAQLDVVLEEIDRLRTAGS